MLLPIRHRHHWQANRREHRIVKEVRSTHSSRAFEMRSKEFEMKAILFPINHTEIHQDMIVHAFEKLLGRGAPGKH